ncbi:MAG: YihY/virulence factor BrkB family protein [Acidobacteriaceae bacterium]|nr:YihY/virulence factor BrkB family protein [Acidobacteriaceae bacterium]
MFLRRAEALIPQEAAVLQQAPVEQGAPPPDPFHLGPRVRVRSWRALWASIRTSLLFLLETEVHVYSFAVAVNILISFFPFLVAMLLLCRYVLHWRPAVDVIIQTVTNYFPEGFGVNFRSYLLPASYARNFSLLSVALLLFTANGIFVPLEVALNRIWRVKRNRSFLQNQIVSLGLIFGCGVLVLASVSATTLNVQFLSSHFGSSKLGALLQAIVFKASAFPATALVIFLIYWLLPNTRIPVRRLIPSSIAVAILLEISKYVNILTWPWLRAKLEKDVPPFVQSISIVLWSFIATLIVLAGAEWSARVTVEKLSDSEAPRERAPN